MLGRLLEPLLQHVHRGMSDDNVDVRNAAMFALGQFSIHLQVQNSCHSVVVREIVTVLGPNR